MKATEEGQHYIFSFPRSSWRLRYDLHEGRTKYQLYLCWNDCRINRMAVKVAKSNCLVIG